MNAQLTPALDELERTWGDEYIERTAGSQRLDVAARGTIAATQRTRFSSGMPYPVYVESGSGTWFTDVDGNEFLDCNAGWNASLFGRGNPVIVEAVIDQMARVGAPGGAMHPSRLRDEFAAQICERMPGAERVVFAPSGSEANTYALRLARHATGKDKVLRITGGFHGQNDYLLGRGSSLNGLPSAVSAGHVSVPYNDLPAAIAALDLHRGELAAVIAEPMMTIPGAVHQRDGFVGGLRLAALERGIPFILDEVISGGRFAVGGAVEHLGIEPPPDIIVLGKMIGGGLPAAVVTGRAELMEQPVSASNTHAQNPMAMASGLAALSLSTPEVFERLRVQGGKLREDLRALTSALDIGVQVTGDGPCIGVHFTELDVIDADIANEADQRLWKAMCLGVTNAGLGISSRTFGPIAPFGNREIEHVITAFRTTLGALDAAVVADRQAVAV